jgi:hypothetical protein
MNYLEYKNILINNNIILFDDDYRISFNNMFILNDSIINSNQHGGGNKDSIYYVSPFTILNKGENKKIKKMIDCLSRNNLNAAKYVCQNNFNLNSI